MRPVWKGRARVEGTRTFVAWDYAGAVVFVVLMVGLRSLDWCIRWLGPSMWIMMEWCAMRSTMAVVTTESPG